MATDPMATGPAAPDASPSDPDAPETLASEALADDMAPPTKRSFFQELLRRRVLQVLGGYAASCASAVLFFNFLTSRYALSPYLVDILLWGLILMVPTVALLAYRHGAPGPQHWTPFHLGSVVVNIVVAVGVLTFAFWGKPLSATTTTITMEGSDGEMIERIVANEGHRKRMLLFPFENATGDAERDWIATAVPALLQADLIQDPFFRVILGHRVNERLARAGFADGRGVPLALQRRIAQEVSYGHVVTGTVRTDETGYALDLDLVDTETGRTQASHAFTGATLADLADAATVALKTDLNLPAIHIEATEDLPAAEVMTASVEALEAYAQGLDARYLRQQPAFARDRLIAATELDPTFARAHLELAGMYFSDQDQAPGLEALRAAQRHDYRLSEPQRYAVKAQRLFFEGQPDQASEAIEQWIALYPDDSDAYSNRAQFRQLQLNYAGMVEDYERVLALDPTAVGLYLTIGDLYRNQIGDFEKALDAYRAFLREGNEPDVAYRRIGLAHENAGQLDSALVVYDQAIAADPENLITLYNQAQVQAKLGRFDEAEAGLARMLSRARTDRERVSANNGLADILQRQGRYPEALDAHRAAWQASRSYGNENAILVTQAFEAIGYAEAGMEAEAERLLADAQASPAYEAPGFYRANVALSAALVAALQGEADEARSLVEAAQEVVDTYNIEQARPLLGFFRAEIDAAQGDYAAAVEPMAVFIESQPPSADFSVRFGNVLAGAGRTDEARAQYEATLALVPVHAEARLGLAKLAIAEGAIEEAQQHLDAALAIWAAAPDSFPFATEARALRAELAA
ncbi:MAG: tetratricopeptide repeat protein [Bacteroidota bacterium]